MMMMRRTTPNQTKMSPRSSENPTNNRIPRAAHLLLDVAATRRRVDDWVSGGDRLQEAARRLGQRLVEVNKAEGQTHLPSHNGER